MNQTKDNNRRILLTARPTGAPVATDFKLEVLPRPEIEDGQVLLRTVYLSLDPYMRGRMSDAKSYTAPLELNDLMPGGTVCRVEESQHANYKPGDWVLSYSGWQD